MCPHLNTSPSRSFPIQMCPHPDVSHPDILYFCVRAIPKSRDLAWISIRFTGNFKTGALGHIGMGTHRHGDILAWGHSGMETHRHSPHISWGHIGMETHRLDAHRHSPDISWGHIWMGTQWARDTSTYSHSEVRLRQNQSTKSQFKISQKVITGSKNPNPNLV